MGRKDSLPEDAPAPRLCELVKWPHFQGYGFNLHSEKGKEGQFIGKIDPESPAEACGLKEGDQIIEVNGVNTSNENHKQVVGRIKTYSDHASLLVVDSKAAEYYKKRNIVVKGTLPNVQHQKSTPAGATHDKETGECETSSQTHLSVEDSLTLAAQGDGSDEPPPVPPKTELASEAQSLAAPAPAAAEPENSEVPPPAESEPEPEAKSEPEVKPAEQPEVKPAEDKPADEKPIEKTVEEKPSEEKPTEKKLEEEKPEEEKPAEKKPEKEKAPEKCPSEDAHDGKSEKPTEKTPEKEVNGAKDTSPTIDTSLQVESGSDRTQPSPAPSASSTGTVESAKSAESGSTAAEGDKFGLKLNMTAAEMREYLKSKKRHDPRNDNLSFKRRHEIVQNM